MRPRIMGSEHLARMLLAGIPAAGPESPREVTLQ